MDRKSSRDDIPSEPIIYNNKEIRIVLVGKTGAGKSFTGNTILGKKHFKAEFSFKSLTKQCDKADSEVDGQQVAVIDTPGLFDTTDAAEKTKTDVVQCISHASPGPHIFLVVIKLVRFTEEEKQTVEIIQHIFGKEADKYSMVLFTHGELLEEQTIEELLEESEDLQELVAKCNGQYHVFSKNMEDRSQVSELLNKIRDITEKNGGRHYTTEMQHKAERKIEEEKQQILEENEEQRLKEQKELKKKIEKKYDASTPVVEDIPSEPIIYNNKQLRIVLVGKTGAGKSTAGNTILGKKHFKAEFSFKSLTKQCDKARGEVDGQQVAVIDTPGLFDTTDAAEKNIKEVVHCINYASPGPHIFLVVIKLGRFTEEEKKTVEIIQHVYGKEADKYSMVLFTHGDLLKGKPIEELLKESKDLQELVAKCNGQYHVFNKNMEDRSQVSELLNKIRDITKKNGGSHYTTEMFQEAERKIEEEKQRILKENEEQKLKEQKELEKKIEKKYEDKIKQKEDDMERQRKLMDEREREKVEAERKLKEMEDKQKKLMAEREREKVEAERKLKEMEDKQKKLMDERKREKEEAERKLKEMEEKQKKLMDERKREKEEAERKQELIISDIPSEPIIYNNKEIRIVLMGKTGAGKSTAGDAILGEKHFKSKFSFKSLTKQCDKARGEVDGQQVAVIDTPGLFDTTDDAEKTIKDFVQCIKYASPGPHIFLVVIKLGRFTEEEKKTVEIIQQIFGEEADKYSMVLFTHGELLEEETIEELLEESEDLQELVAKCNGQYHVFNKNMEDRSQVSELLNKIRDITEKNGVSHYTNEMFQEAERAIEEEKQRILKDNEEQRLKEQKELEKKIEKKYEDKIKGVKDDMEKQRKLMAEREREKEEEIRKLKEEQENKARSGAEGRDVRAGIAERALAGAARGALIAGPAGAVVGAVVGGLKEDCAIM